MTGEIRECQSLSKRLNELMYSLEIAASSLGKMYFRQNPGKINSFRPPNPPVWILGGACDFVAFKQNSHKKKGSWGMSGSSGSSNPFAVLHSENRHAAECSAHPDLNT